VEKLADIEGAAKSLALLLDALPGSKTIAAMHSRCPLWVISGHFGMESGYPASIGRCAIEVEVADHIVAVAPVELLISFK
jgi:hypothetical protein